MAGMGHNKGPAMDRGRAWRRHCWTKARRDLLPTLPLEVARMRIRRARELGLDYSAYAKVRATTGRDVIALLFSTNALRLFDGKAMPEARRAHVLSIRHADKLIAAHPPLSAEGARKALTAEGIDIDHAALAPSFVASYRDTKSILDALRGKHPSDGILLIGDTAFEQSWCAVGRLAGYLPSDAYFGTVSPELSQ